MRIYDDEVAMGYLRPAIFDGLERVFAGFGTRGAAPPAQLATLKQIHSARVVAVDRAGYAGEGDALVTNTPGVLVGVKTADCVPILLVDPERRAAAAVHAGWRGSAAGILTRAVEAMTRQFGCRPESLLAAIGPAIGECCYEVGPEVAREFGDESGGKVHLDLAGINLRQLTLAGVPERNIEVMGLCTFCEPTQFYSFRREKEEAGRMFSVVGILPNSGVPESTESFNLASLDCLS